MVKNENKIYKESLHKSERLIRFWSNALGELHSTLRYSLHKEDLPVPLQYAYEELWNDRSGLNEYLVDFQDRYYVGISYVIEDTYAESLDMSEDKLSQIIFAYAKKLMQDKSLKDVILVIRDEEDNWFNNEIIFLVPALTSKKDFSEIEQFLVHKILEADLYKLVIDRIVEINKNLPKDSGRDAGTVLRNAGYAGLNEKELFDIYMNREGTGFVKLFHCLTGFSFGEYLEGCLEAEEYLKIPLRTYDVLFSYLTPDNFDKNVDDVDDERYVIGHITTADKGELLRAINAQDCNYFKDYSEDVKKLLSSTNYLKDSLCAVRILSENGYKIPENIRK